MTLSEREALRYLGFRGSAVHDQHDQAEVERALSLIRLIRGELEAKIKPKSSFRIFDCRAEPPVTEIGGVVINSKNLSEHLRGCRKAALMAVTLGVEADALIRRRSVTDMAQAAVAQAVCAALTEEHCDRLESEITARPEVCRLRHASRFSPGYGDFNIIHQKDILRLLDCAKIGLTLTDGYMLAPSKSVTAVIGFAEEEGNETHPKHPTHQTHKKDAQNKCESCDNRQCAYREV